ncbi:hypothetical protein L2737_18480 [Shewanella electrodiphila]|uniref:Uncharacterized protein n=1 Tax=Shewanella electrodiphila TaxID=934143 RepID=A0ABT0KTX9_9GAMM|nr:hypothetical protein [Shewanella electrodiphila]MCL1047290.1 hypothetical protein [Shewanella electrodiphila]
MASIILPVALLILSFMVKMSIEREVDLPKALQSLIELPSDIMFLSSSLVIAYILGNTSEIDDGLLWFVGCVVLSIIVVLLWRKSESQLSKKSWHALWISTISYLIAIPVLVLSISINIPVVQP